MSGGLQESSEGRRHSKSSLTARLKSRAQQATLRAQVKQDASLLLWLCLVLFSVLRACHTCCLAMQRQGRGSSALRSSVASLRLCCFLFFVVLYDCVWCFVFYQVPGDYSCSCGYRSTQLTVRNVLPLPPVTWFNPRMIRSPWWPPWLPTETETDSLWS